MSVKFRKFQKQFVCLTTRQTTSGAAIDLTVATCASVIFRKSHKKAQPNSGQKFLVTQKYCVLV